MLALGIVAVLAASAAYNAGVVLQALDAREEPEACGLKLALLGRLLRPKRWLAGTILSLLAFPVQVRAYANAPISVVQPGLAVGIVAPYVLRQRMPAYAAMLTASAGVAFAWSDIATKLFGDGVNGDRFAIAGFWLAAVIVA